MLVSNPVNGMTSLFGRFSLLLFVITFSFYSGAQRLEQISSTNVHVQQLGHYGTSAPLSEMVSRNAIPMNRRVIPIRPIPISGANVLGTAQRDAAEQTSITPSLATTSGQNFEGLGKGFVGPGGVFIMDSLPGDPNLSVGATQVVQWVNTSFAVFDKTTGTALLGPLRGNVIFAGVPNKCATTNDGDPVVIYDKRANRWVLTQFAVTNPVTGNLAAPFLQCIAISTTSDARGTWHLYSLSFNNLNDYPKLGVWPDAYYMSFNMFNVSVNPNVFLGSEACALQRSKMLAGQPAAAICTAPLGASRGGLLPSDLDGATLPPSGTPNFFMNFGSNSLNLWKFHVNFVTPSSSTFTGPRSLAVAAFTPACGGGACIPQSGTTQKLDSLADRLMFRLAYRNLGGHQSLVLNHSVKSSIAAAGIRWYEVRSPNGTPVVFQQGTFSPSSTSRWMGSVAMDKAGDMAVGYSASSGSIHPGIRYSGRLPADPLGKLESEVSLISGGGSQVSSATCKSGDCALRWGDYSSLSIDPVSDCIFWYTNEYLKANGNFNWHTRIGSFRFPGCQ